MIVLRGFIILTLFIVSSSCTSLLQNTVGRYIYKKYYLPSPTLGKNDFYTELPYEFRNGWIFLKVKINGNQKEYDFFFDTGSRSFISENVTKELGIFPITSTRTVDVNGSETHANLYKINMSLDKFHVSGLGVLSKDFTPITKGCYKIDGIIGANILDQAIFHFDTQRQVLIITNSINEISKEKRNIGLKLKKAWNGHSFVKLRVNKRNAKFLFDTGSANLLLIRPGLVDREIPIKQRIGYVGGLHSSKQTTLSIYKAENIKFKKQSLAKDPESFIISSQNMENNLGSEIFKFYHVTIYRKQKRLYFSPNQLNNAKKTGPIPNLQLNWEEGRVFISALTIDSELEKMGIQINDTVVSINNIASNSFKNYCAFSSFKETLATNGIKNIILQKQGKEIEYIITDKMLYE